MLTVVCVLLALVATLLWLLLHEATKTNRELSRFRQELYTALYPLDGMAVDDSHVSRGLTLLHKVAKEAEDIGFELRQRAPTER